MVDKIETPDDEELFKLLDMTDKEKREYIDKKLAEPYKEE